MTRRDPKGEAPSFVTKHPRETPPDDAAPDPVTDPDGWYRHFYAVNAAHLARRADAQARQGRLRQQPTAGGRSTPDDGGTTATGTDPASQKIAP